MNSPRPQRNAHYATCTTPRGVLSSPNTLAASFSTKKNAPSLPSTPPHTMHSTTSNSASKRKPLRPTSASIVNSTYTSSFMTQAAKGTTNNLQSLQALHQQRRPRGPGLLPTPSPTDQRHLLVLDMDETLLHASTSTGCEDFSIIVNMDGSGQDVIVYIALRPHLDAFLKFCAQHFEVCVFTASIPKYANQVLDRIDPTGQYIQHRLFREHCTEQRDGIYVKDLERLGRSLQKIIIVDNSPLAYSFHPRNAIACSSWYDCMQDNELQILMSWLDRLYQSPCVYPVLEQLRRCGIHPNNQ